MPTLFTRIIQGEVPCHKILEDDRFFSFLDIRPIVQGHTLVVPKKEVDYVFDLDEVLMKEILLFSKKIAAALRKVIPCKRIGIMVAGLEVPHTHIHLVPIQSVMDLNFANAKAAEAGALAATAEKIRAAL